MPMVENMNRDNFLGTAKEHCYKKNMLLAEKTRLLFSGLKYSIVGNLVIASLLTLLVGEYVVNAAGLWIWWVVIIGVSLFRMAVYMGYTKVPPESQQNALWLRLFSLGAWLMAVVWVASFWVFPVPENSEYTYMALLAIISISGGALPVLSYHFSVFLVFELLLSVGLVSRLLWQGDAFSLQLVVLLVLFYGFLLRGGYSICQIVSRGIQLHLDAEHSQRELQRARDEAVAASRIKGEILATLGHEINMPINGVLGMTDLLLDSTLDTRQKTLVKAIRCSSESLLGVIDHVLAYSNIESGRLALREELFNLRQLLDDVGDMMSDQAREKRLRFNANLSASLPLQVWGDPIRLRQVLVNLLGNAIRYTGHGEVSLDAQVLWASDQEVAVQISVSDTGPGIPADRQQSIFLPFEQIKANAEGLSRGAGLGLSIVRELLQLMNSEITLDSQVDEGSRFSFILHLRPQQRSEQLMPETLYGEVSADTGLTAGLKVLLLAENQANREAILAMLANLHVDVDPLDSEADVLQAIASDCHHLLLIDCQVSKKNGMDVAEMVRRHELSEQLPRIPIVAITPDAGRRKGSHLRSAGMDAYLSRPFDTEMLMRKLQQWADPRRCQKLEQDAVLNPLVLEQLGRNGRRRLRNTITLYLWNAPEQMKSLSTAIDRGVWGKAKTALQKLKTSSDALGAEKVVALCEQIETELEDANAQRLAELVSELEQAFDRVVAVLREQ